MADARQAERAATEATKQSARRIAEDTSGTARTAAEACVNAARAGADLFQRNAETAQQSLRSGAKMASELIEQSVQQFARAFGAGEHAQQVTQQSARNVESIAQPGVIIAGGMQIISRELLNFAHKRMEQNLETADVAMSCRIPQEFMAAQSNFMRDNLEAFVHGMRRIAEISMQTAAEAARRKIG